MTTARLTWDPSADNVGVAQYLIFRIVDNQAWDLADPFASVPGDTLTYDDTTLTANHTYRWLVIAEDATGNQSLYSALVSASTLTSDVTSAPLNLAVTPSTTKNDLSWDPPSTIPSFVEGYLITRNGALAWLNGGQDLTWQDFNLAAQASYTYQVYAISPANNVSPGSNSVTVSTLVDTTPPTPPVAVPIATALNTTTVLVDWDAFTDNVGVTTYQVYRNTVLLGSFSAAGTVYQDTNCTASTSYTYQIVAIDAALNASTPITTNTVTTPATNASDVTSAPRSLVTTPHTTQVDLSWTAPLTIPTVIDRYLITIDGFLAQTVAGNVLAWQATNLDPQTSYAFQVYAISPSNTTSPGSNVVNTTTLADTLAPVPPAAPPVATARNTTDATVEWDAFTDNVGVTQYKIFRNTVLIGTIPASGTTYWDTTCTANTGYIYQIKAVDAANNLSAAITANGITTPPTGGADVTSAPRSLACTPHTTQMDLTWVAPLTIPTSVDHYLITINGNLAQNVTGTTWQATNLDPETSYTFRVYAISPSNNTSPSSNTVTVSTLADTLPPAPPSQDPVATALNTTQVLIDWLPFTDNVAVAAYQVLRNGSAIGSVAASVTTYWDKNCSPGTGYIYEIVAVDSSFNASAPIATNGVTTPTVNGPGVYTIPTSIDRTGVKDVTLPLRNWIRDVVPNGADAFHPTTVVAPANSLYRVEGEVQIQDRKNINFKWQNSTIFCRTDGSYLPPGGDLNNPGAFSSQWPRNRVTLDLIQCVFVNMQDLTVMGADFPGNAHGCYGRYARIYLNPSSPIVCEDPILGGNCAHGYITIPTATHQLTANINTTQTTITVDSTSGFVAPPFYVCVGDMNADYEVMRVTNVAGLTLTVQRSGNANNLAWPTYSIKRNRNTGEQVHLGRSGAQAAVGLMGFVGRLEGQHPIRVRGNNKGGPPFDGHDVKITNIKTMYPFGDGLAVAMNAYRTFLRNCTFLNHGRQGSAPGGATILEHDNCHWDESSRSVFDIEPASDFTCNRQIIWRNCSNGWANGNFANMNGRGRGWSTPPYGMSDITWQDHFSVRPITGKFRRASKWNLEYDNPWGPVSFIRVKSDHGSNAPDGAIRFRRCYGLTLKGFWAFYYASGQANTGHWELEWHCKGYNSAGQLVDLIKDNGTQDNSCRSDQGGSVGQQTPNNSRVLMSTSIYPKNYYPKNSQTGANQDRDWFGTNAHTD